MNAPTYSRWDVDVYHGDCLDVLSTLGDASVDSVVTDPPYALEFMGKTWDKYTPASYQAWCEKWATECLRVLKPGGHLLSFGGTRTAHRLACGIEDAGLELCDTITWMYGSGFPKSRRISADIDRTLGSPRSRVILGSGIGSGMGDDRYVGGNNHSPTAPLAGTKADNVPRTEEAKQWDGWGTALKPAGEPIIVARKPFKGTVAQNVLTYGTGGMNIDGCRVNTQDKLVRPAVLRNDNEVYGKGLGAGVQDEPEGRWPSNLVLSHASTVDDEDACVDGCVEGCPVAELDAQSGISSSSKPSKQIAYGAAQQNGINEIYGVGLHSSTPNVAPYGDSGGASRFYPVFRYQAKAPTSQRPVFDGKRHATVKPLALMRWLVRLVTPPGGLVLDPLCGTGTTGQACRAEGFKAILIEKEAEYLPLIKARLNALPKTETGTLLTDEDAPKEALDLFDLLSGEAS